MIEPTRVAEGELPFGQGVTHYRVVGGVDNSPVPLVILHGGPGMTWDYLEEFDALAPAGRAIVYYDQIGNGQSRPLGSDAVDNIGLDLLVDQLEYLLDGLKISDSYAILAHSSGAMIALEHALRRPNGLRALVLANSFASTRLMRESISGLRAQLPLPIREILEHHEAAGTVYSPEYAAATGEFMSRHVCRVRFPAGLMRTFVALGENPHVFTKLWGRSVFDGSGSYADWTAEGRLGDIRVPTLVYRGQFDEAGEKCVAPFADIPGVERLVFKGASHLPHIEVQAECLSRISSFLTAADEAF